MSNCITCGKAHNRKKGNSMTLPAKHCSVECVKRNWYLKNNPNARSFFRDDAGFWESETGIGYKWEIYVADKIGGTHMPFNKDGIDVSVSWGNLDVKVCEKYGPQWVFNKNKSKPVIDFYYCICLENGKVAKELLIPTDQFLGKGITVGTVSAKYDKFKTLA